MKTEEPSVRICVAGTLIFGRAAPTTKEEAVHGVDLGNRRAAGEDHRYCFNPFST
jgi:hypothetical protein